MATLAQKVGSVLAQRFAGASLELKRLRPGDRIGGTVVWDGFTGLSQLDRQTQLRDALIEALAPDEHVKVSFILTVTPVERAAMTAKVAG